ncbi:MAG: hypothetical protein ACXABY_03120 [Candidatus Thorarchaeota archaeon]|jgi:uncharacterized membrane protein
MMRMNRSALAGLSVVIVVMIVFTIMWILDITSLGSIMGAIGGMVGGVLGVTYMQRVHDERFNLVKNQAARNSFLFVTITLPFSWIALIRAEMVTIPLAVGLSLAIWMSSFGVYYLSLFYYYKR